MSLRGSGREIDGRGTTKILSGRVAAQDPCKLLRCVHRDQMLENKS